MMTPDTEATDTARVGAMISQLDTLNKQRRRVDKECQGLYSPGYAAAASMEDNVYAAAASMEDNVDGIPLSCARYTAWLAATQELVKINQEVNDKCQEIEDACAPVGVGFVCRQDIDSPHLLVTCPG